MHYFIVIFLVFIFQCVAVSGSDTPVTVITVIIGDNPAYGYHVQAPAYDASFSSMQLAYPGALRKVTRYMFHKPGMYTCNDAAAMMQTVAGEIDQLIRRLNGTTILISPGCSFEILVLGDFAREWDVLLLATISTDKAFADRSRFPSVISFTPTDYSSYMTGLQQFLVQFGWTTVTLVCDTLSGSPLGAFSQITCLNLRRLFDQSRGSSSLFEIQIDSGRNGTVSYDNLLAQARKQSRVIILMTRPHVLRKLMVSAFRSNMTNGDYAFVGIIANKVPMIEDPNWRYGDANDAEARHAFRSLILVSSPNPNWERIDPLLEDIRSISREVYKTNQTSHEGTKDHLPLQRNDLTVCAYEVVASLAQTMNESADILPTQDVSGKSLASLFLNRTFTLPSRDAYIAANGIRASDVEFARLNSSTGQMQTQWRYLAASGTLLQISEVDWISPSGPPINQPPCGFMNERCYSEEGKKVLTRSIGGTLGGLFVFLTAVIAVWMYRNHQDSNRWSSLWWCLDVTSIKLDCQHAVSRKSKNFRCPGE